MARSRNIGLVLLLAFSMILLASAGASAQEARGTPGLQVRKVDTLPRIDGKTTDPQWDSAIGLIYTPKNVLWKAVYTDEEIAFLLQFDAPTTTIVCPDDWYLVGDRWLHWRDYRIELGDPWDMDRPRWDSLNVVWEIDDFDLEAGCQYFCHDVEGTGQGRHVVREGGSGDLWPLTAKHGMGAYSSGKKIPGYDITLSLLDTGWYLGYLGVAQAGPVEFVTDEPQNPYRLVSGSLTYLGWADAHYQTWHDNPAFKGTAEATEGGRYCLECHDKAFVEGNSVQAKNGPLPYRPNGSRMPGDDSGPEYIKVNPVNFADASVITDRDIKEGRAVRVADLTPEQVKAAWHKYEQVNALVPSLILQELDGKPSDILVAANWADGKWTLEFKRSLTTDDPVMDVQFDPSQRYAAFVPGGFPGQGPIHVVFEQP